MPNGAGAGTILVGYSEDGVGSYDPQAWSWQNGVLTILPGIPGYVGEKAYDVTDAGLIVGMAGGGAAVAWRNNQLIDLTPPCIALVPGASYSYAKAVAVTPSGRTLIAGSCGSLPFVWYDDGVGGFAGEMLPMLLGDTGGEATDVNGAGYLVGYSSVGYCAGGPFCSSDRKPVKWTFTPPPLNAPPVAASGGPYTGSEGTPVALDGSASSDPNGDVLTYAWDFGDGSPLGSGATPTHSYVQNGGYTLTLTVQDPGGLTSLASTTVTVANAPPAPNAGPDRTVVANRSLTYSVAFADAGTLDAPWNYVVQWGDGTANTSKQTNVQGVQPALAHTYNTVGTFTRRLTVTDKDGDSALDEAIISVVANSPPIAAVTGPYTGHEGTAVAMASTGSSDPNGDALTYAWKFGDGTTSSVANPSKVYSDNGAFTVTLIVKDPSGAADTATTTATINNVAPTASFSAPTTVTEGVAIALAMNSGTDKGAADRPTLQYAFDCGQGAGLTPFTSTKTMSCPALPDQRPPVAVVGQIRDKDGGLTSYTKNVSVTNATPIVTLAAPTPTTFVVGGSLGVQGSFTDKGITDQPWTYSVAWGDGKPATTGSTGVQGALVPLNHTYTATGTFSVQLTVKDKDNKAGVSTKVTVVVTP